MGSKMELGPPYPWCWPSKYFLVATGLKNPCCKLFHFFDCVYFISFFLFLNKFFWKMCKKMKKKNTSYLVFKEQVLWKRKAEQDGGDRQTRWECSSLHRMVRVKSRGAKIWTDSWEMRYRPCRWLEKEHFHVEETANAKAQRGEKPLAHQRTCKKARVTKTK